MNILQRHMWYLTPELVPLSFDDAGSSDGKSHIVKAIMAHQIPDVFVPGKPDFKHLWNHSDISLKLIFYSNSDIDTISSVIF